MAGTPADSESSADGGPGRAHNPERAAEGDASKLPHPLEVGDARAGPAQPTSPPRQERPEGNYVSQPAPHDATAADASTAQAAVEMTGTGEQVVGPRLLSWGLITFLLDPAAILRWCQLTLLTFLMLALSSYAMYFAGSSGPQKMFAVLLCLVLAPTSIVFVYLVSISCLVIVEDTASGHQLIQAWPGLNLFEWLGQSLYVINAVVFSALPGALVGQVASLHDSMFGGAILLGCVSGFLLFPLMLLSMIVMDSPLAAASPIVLRSVRTMAGAWKAFYAGAGLLGGVIGLGVLLFLARGWLSLALASALIVTAVTIYFRLLGRLAQIIAENSDADAEHVDDVTPSREGSD